MNGVGARRLLKLADFLDHLPRKLFNYRWFLNTGEKSPLEAYATGGGCGTTACAMGWTPMVFPHLVKWTGFDSSDSLRQTNCRYKQLPIDIGIGIFDLTHEEFRFLFIPEYLTYSSSIVGSCGVDEAPKRNATPKQVARHIRRYVYSQRPDMKVKA